MRERQQAGAALDAAHVAEVAVDLEQLLGGATGAAMQPVHVLRHYGSESAGTRWPEYDISTVSIPL